MTLADGMSPDQKKKGPRAHKNIYSKIIEIPAA